MRWMKYEKPNPAHGAKKVVRKFLFLPREKFVNNNPTDYAKQYRWLEFANIQETYCYYEWEETTYWID